MRIAYVLPLILAATFASAQDVSDADRLEAEYLARMAGKVVPEATAVEESPANNEQFALSDPTLEQLEAAEDIVDAISADISSSSHEIAPRQNPLYLRFDAAVEKRNAIKTAYWEKHPKSPPDKETKASIERVVRETLKDPDSAKFKSIGFDAWGQACGFVNAKNSFGGYTGFKRFTVHPKSGVAIESEIFPARFECRSVAED